MYENLRVAVVIPAYCEAKRIAGVVQSLPAWVDLIVAVDDASKDQTYQVLKELTDPRLIVLRHDHNQGVGAATMTGFAEALKHGADVLVKMDGDGQMDPAGLPSLLAPIQREQADYVKGNRFLHVRELAQMPWVRRCGNIGLSFLTKMASGYWTIFDPNNGYVALHSSLWPLLDQDRVHPRFFFESSLLLELGLSRAVVRDVYLPARYGDKVSSLSEYKVLREFPPLLLKGFLRRLVMQYYVRDFTAVSLFLVTGLTASLFGTLWGLYFWHRSALLGVVTPTGTVMIAVLPIILGIQLLLQAWVMDIQHTPVTPVYPAQIKEK